MIDGREILASEYFTDHPEMVHGTYRAGESTGRAEGDAVGYETGQAAWAASGLRVRQLTQPDPAEAMNLNHATLLLAIARPESARHGRWRGRRRSSNACLAPTGLPSEAMAVADSDLLPSGHRHCQKSMPRHWRSYSCAIG